MVVISPILQTNLLPDRSLSVNVSMVKAG